MPAENLQLTYREAPGFLPIYRRLLLGRRKPYQRGAALPPFHAVWKGARADTARIQRYRDACGLPDDGCYPLLYPHVLTSPIHIDIISRPQFPLSPMGAVHTRMHVLQHAPIAADAVVDIECRLTDTRVLKAGVEFEITTTLAQNGKVVWESLSANLIRGKKFGEPVDGSPLANLPELESTMAAFEWDVPKDMGWRYAKITGDYNPIHVSRVLAKFMGFDRDLIHGMWSAARCLGHLNAPAATGPVRLDLLFKGPVYMESHVTLKVMHRGAPALLDTYNDVNPDAKAAIKLSHGDTDQLFDLYCGDNPRPVIRGHLRPAESGAALVSPENA